MRSLNCNEDAKESEGELGHDFGWRDLKSEGVFDDLEACANNGGEKILVFIDQSFISEGRLPNRLNDILVAKGMF